MFNIISIREMKMKTTVSYYIILIRIYAIKKIKNPKNQKTTIGKHVEKAKTLFSVGGKVKWCRPFGKYYGSSSEN